MAKVKNPLNSVQAAGSAGGVTYARNHYGQYARTWFSPVQPDSASQLSWRAAMTQANAWYQDPATVTPANISRWYEFSKNYTWTNQFGNQIYLNAKEWFIKQNVWRAIASLAPVVSPPPSPSLDWFPSITIYWDTAGIYCDCFPVPTNDQFVYCRKAGPVSHTRNFCPNTIAFAGILNSTTGSPILLVDALDIDTDPHNWFVIIRIIDNEGKSSSKIYYKIYTIGSAPTAILELSSTNGINNDNASTVFRNQSTIFIFDQ